MVTIIATGINELDEELAKEIENSKIVGYKEYLTSMEEKPDLVILSTELAGDNEIKMSSVLYTLKSKAKRIIFITYEDDVENILQCFTLSIYDLFISDEGVSKEDVIKLIKNPKHWDDVKGIYLKYSAKKANVPVPKPIINKIEGNENTTEKKEPEIKPKQQAPKIKIVEKRIVEKQIETHIETNVLKPNVISFYTADNHILCNYLLANIAASFKKKTNHNILVIDNDILPCMDQLFNVDKNIPAINNFSPNSIDTGLSACYASIENKTFSSDLLNEFIQKSKYGVDVLTGIYNNDIADLMSVEHYEEIIDTAKEIYDVILIATNPFKSSAGTVASIIKSNKVIVVTESNYLSCRNNFTVLTDYRAICKGTNRFGIVTIKTDHPLDEGIVEHVFSEYKLLACLDRDKNCNKLINTRTLNKGLFSNLNKNAAQYNGILSFLGVTNTVVVKNISKIPDIEKKKEEKTKKSIFSFLEVLKK